MVKITAAEIEEIEKAGFSWEIAGKMLFAYKTEYLDNGMGLHGFVRTEVSVDLESGEREVIVDDFSAEAIEEREAELFRKCQNPEASCDECDLAECEVFADLEWLNMLRNTIEGWEFNFPVSEKEG